MLEKTSEINTEIKVLNDEIASVRVQREELHREYIENDFVYANRMTELIKKRYALVQNKKYEDRKYDSNR